MAKVWKLVDSETNEVVKEGKIATPSRTSVDLHGQRNYEIKKGLPIPDHKFRLGRVPQYTKYPFPALEIGDAFEEPILRGENAQRVGNRVAAAAKSWNKANGRTIHLTWRADPSGQFVTIWRDR